MGHREELLAAARRCLEERGYAHTTARDLVAASGTNLASIGYHFGSKDALLAEALMESFTEYLDKVLSAASAAASDDPGQAVGSAWAAMTDLLKDYRPLLVAFVEALAQSERDGPLRKGLADGYERMRLAVVASAIDAFPGLGQSDARSVASFMIAACDGLMVQYLLDPERAPTGAQLLSGAQLAMASTL